MAMCWKNQDTHAVVIGPKVSDSLSCGQSAFFYLLVVPENKSIGTNT